jgi:hypothetical protein
LQCAELQRQRIHVAMRRHFELIQCQVFLADGRAHRRDFAQCAFARTADELGGDEAESDTRDGKNGDNGAEPTARPPVPQIEGGRCRIGFCDDNDIHAE